MTGPHSASTCPRAKRADRTRRDGNRDTGRRGGRRARPSTILCHESIRRPRRCHVKTSGRALSAVLIAALLFLGVAATTSPAAAPVAGASLSGQLLVALPSLDDPRFKRTVVYMLVHDARGAMG